MKQWQREVIDHHPESEILNETQVFIPNVAWIPETEEYFDHILTWDKNYQQLIIEEYKHGTNELINTEYETEGIYNYLGY